MLLPAGLHLMSRSLKGEEEAHTWCGSAGVTGRQLSREQADGDRTADSRDDSSGRTEMAHVSELNFPNREHAGQVLECVQVMGGHASEFTSSEHRVSI